MGDVGGGAAHIESDNARKAANRSCAGSTDNAACRALIKWHPCPESDAHRQDRHWTA